MARIVSMTKARQPGSCKVFKYKGKKHAVCKGVIGILGPKEVSVLVRKPIPASKRTKRVEKHWKKFEKIAKICQRKSANLPRPKKGQAFQKCMLKETRRAGIKL